MSYENMLDDAREEIPEPEEAHDRFQVPDVSGRIEGGRTIITNFDAIADTLRREPSHLLKFLNRELATRGAIEGKTAELERRLRPNQLNEKIKDYKERFVVCPSCEKADTVLNKDGTDYMMKCQACGHVEEFTEKF
jgi:translation initiation factor 2 subunit 2